jgi:uncharacterized protein (TIGR00369 family)
MLDLLGGGEVLHSDPAAGEITLRFVVRNDHCHPGGAQGGFITGWIDAAMAQAVMGHSEYQAVPATLEIKVSFLRPVRPLQEVRASARIVRMGKSVAFLEGELRDVEGVLLATGSSTARLVPFGGLEDAVIG